MSSITVNTLVLGSLTVSVDGTDSTLALSVLGTAPASLSIELGTPGAQGDAATIAVGTTSTLSPGASATVTNVGTSSAAVFNFGIPAGQTGATGATGSQGPAGDAATISVGTTTTGAAGSSATVANVGTSSAAVFNFTIPRGDKGETGNTGATGATGIPGTAATITAGTTTTGAAGSSATVTNSGTSSAAVFNFTIPRGDTGATGATGATGPAGPGVAAGGTAGQSLLKVDGTDYNTTWGTPSLASHAETTQATVRNSTGSTLTPGQIVYINGALGNRPTVALSKADAEATSAGTYAMVETSIPNNTDGTVITAGTVSGLDTSALADGDRLYLSPTTAGAWTTTKPSAPNHLVYIGTVTRAHPTLGTVQLRIQNGYELDEIHDVAIASKANNDLLAYDAATGLWKNKTLATLDIQGATAAASAFAAKSANLSDLASASTARTNLGLGTAAVEPATKLVPTGGTTGQVLAKNSATNWDLSWVTPSSGSGGVNIQVFGSSTTSGSFTWTKPANAKMVFIWLVGGGGGGGSGARYASTSSRGGGGGGAGGSTLTKWINAAFLASTETVVVGTGNTGATAVTVDSTNGTAPASLTASFSSFGGFRTYGPITGGGGGTNGAGGTAGNNGNLLVEYGTIAQPVGMVGFAGAITSNSSFGNTYMGGLIPAGGGGGGGATASVAANGTGSFGVGHGAYNNLTGPGRTTAIAGGSRGGAVGATDPAGNGVDGGFSSSFNGFVAGTGGGGGYYAIGVAGGKGGNGGWPGGGGGGGGASDNGFASGAGGNGANGIVVVITYS